MAIDANINLMVSKWTKETVKKVAKEYDITANEYIRQVIEADLLSRGHKEPKKKLNDQLKLD